MTNAAALARKSKERHPENYCPVKGCLWRTGPAPVTRTETITIGGRSFERTYVSSRRPCPKHTEAA